MNLLFLAIIKTLGSTAINRFYHALVITGQDHLAQLLTESKCVTPMTEAEKNAAKDSRLVAIMN